MQNPARDIHGVSLHERLKPILESRPYITSLSLFGSRARGDYDALSDYDFHVGFDHDLGALSDFLAFCDEIEAELETRCDFISTPIDRLNVPLAEEVNRDKVVLYERTEK